MPRYLDIIISIFLMIVLSPLFIIIISIYLIHGSISFFYIQKRIGKNEQIFNIYKFRSLNHESKKNKFIFGSFLRNSSLDELPQLLNIIKGQMALVGPRPLPANYLPYFTLNQRVRFNVKPGLTGLSQINGRTEIPWKKKLSFDVDYVNKRSFAMDINILFKTIIILFSERPKNALTEISLIEYLEKEPKKIS